MHPLSESGFSFDKLSPVSFQPSPYLRLLESHMQNETHHSDHRTEVQSSHGHTEVQSSHGHTEVQSSHGHTEVQSSHGHTEVQSSHGHTEIQFSQCHTEIQSSHGHTEIQSSHGHTEIQSNYKTTGFHRTLQLTGLPSSYQVSESCPRSPPIPFKVLQPADPSDPLLSFTPALGGMLQCLQKLEEEVSQVNGVMHRSKPITFLTTYYCYRQSWFYFLSLLWCFLSLLPLNTLQRKVQAEITRQFNKKSIKERAQQLSCLFTGKPPQPQVKS